MTDEGKYPKIDGDIYYAADANQSYYQGTLSTTADYGDVTITSSSTSIVSADADRKRILIRNIGSYTVYVGVSGVTTSTGTPLDPNVCIVLNTDDAIFGITSSTSSEIRYLEVL